MVSSRLFPGFILAAISHSLPIGIPRACIINGLARLWQALFEQGLHLVSCLLERQLEIRHILITHGPRDPQTIFTCRNPVGLLIV